MPTPLPQEGYIKFPQPPKPPSSLNKQTESQSTQAIFLKFSPLPQKNLNKDSIEEIIPAGVLKKERK